MRSFLAGLVLTAFAMPVNALAPDASQRPLARGQEPVAALMRPKPRPTAKAEAAVQAMLPVRPLVRPVSEQEKAMQTVAGAGEAEIIFASMAVVTLPHSLHPVERPKGLAEKVMAKRRNERRARAKGAVCGDPDLQGEVVGMVPGRINGCGVKNAIKLRSVSGVALSQQSIMDCNTAKALKTWVNKGVRPALGKRGGGVASLKVAAHYACRTRNNKRGAKISEHGKGRAIDISGVTLRNGEAITVLKGWHTARDGKALKQMHRAACGPFGTVLGPSADRYHQDHFHFDTARYRSGSYCR